mgnify:FL=1
MIRLMYAVAALMLFGIALLELSTGAMSSRTAMAGLGGAVLAVLAALGKG